MTSVLFSRCTIWTWSRRSLGTYQIRPNASFYIFKSTVDGSYFPSWTHTGDIILKKNSLEPCNRSVMKLLCNKICPTSTVFVPQYLIDFLLIVVILTLLTSIYRQLDNITGGRSFSGFHCTQIDSSIHRNCAIDSQRRWTNTSSPIRDVSTNGVYVAPLHLCQSTLRVSVNVHCNVTGVPVVTVHDRWLTSGVSSRLNIIKYYKHQS